MSNESLTGRKIGKYTVGEKINAPHPTYTCVCECGAVKNVRASFLKRGIQTQCRRCASSKPRPEATLKVIGKCRKGHDIAVVGTVGGDQKKDTCALCRWEGYILRTYGLTVEEYKNLFALQGGKCAICKKPLLLHFSLGISTEGVRAEIDHKHIPKKLKPQPPKRDTVRGLLCGGRFAGCNRKLGHVDDITWLTSAIEYLKNPPAQRLRK
jgi:hypothetical protein